VTALAALAMLLRLPHLGRGLAEDELNTAVYLVAARSVVTILTSALAFNNHIEYSLLARVFEGVLGRSEWSLRLPALLFGLATLPALWLFSRDLVGRGVALAAVAVLAVSPAHIVESISARGYSGLILFTLLSSYFFLRLRRRANRREACLYVVTSVLGIYVHLYAASVTIIQLLLVVAEPDVRSSVRHPRASTVSASSRALLACFGVIAAAAGILYLPAARSFLTTLVDRGTGQPDPWLPWQMLQRLAGIDSPLAVVILMIGSVIGLWALATYKRSAAIYLSLLLLLPMAATFVARPYDVYARFFLYWLPYFVLFATLGGWTVWQWASTRQRYWTRVLVALGVGYVLYAWAVGWRTYLPDPGYREASTLAQAGADESIGLCAIGAEADAWQYYFARPLVLPQSIAQLLEFSRNYREVRCVQYDAPWQGPEQTELAQFLSQHGEREQIKDRLLYTFGN
jgi:uncharacterized membrane protein